MTKVKKDGIKLFIVALASFLMLVFCIVAASPDSTLRFIDPTPALDSSITILNLQSYPSIGENWTVMFNTAGPANLTITPVNNTYFGVDIQFLGLRCGDGVVNATYTEHSVFYLYTSAGKINGVDDFNGTDASLSSEFQHFHFLTDFENLEKEVLR